MREYADTSCVSLGSAPVGAGLSDAFPQRKPAARCAIGPRGFSKLMWGASLPGMPDGLETWPSREMCPRVHAANPITSSIGHVRRAEAPDVECNRLRGRS